MGSFIEKCIKRASETDNKVFLFLDKSNTPRVATFKQSLEPYRSANVTAYSDSGEAVGYTRMMVDPFEKMRIYLEYIYCYSKYRRLGITSNLLKFTEYLMRENEGYLIRGDFRPFQDEYDKIEGLREEDLINGSATFYRSEGYSHVSYQDFLNNRRAYPDLNEFADFIKGNVPLERLIYKRLKGENSDNYEEVNGVIIAKNVEFPEYCKKLVKK